MLLFRTIKVISPPLQHFTAFRQILSVIVGGANVVAFAVGKLPFNHVGRKTIHIENGAGRNTKYRNPPGNPIREP